MSKTLTLASLFDGSGGFPLAATLTGIKPLWASEIEPFPIRVTTKRLPYVKHLGDVSKIKGDAVDAVDIITFGSPCQDMSIAGKRAGLSGSRSNLFFEAVRIVKEMRRKTGGQKPRYIVWENVPGAFSSNKGEDFEKVIKEICAVKGHSFNAPRPEKWSSAGLVMAEDFSLAWRVLDASYFGVPQRRKRIFLVADFDGQSAGKILFEQESMPGDFTASGKPWQETTGHFETGTGDAIERYCLNDQGGSRMDVFENKSGTLTASVGNHPPLVFENHGQDSRYKGPLSVSQTVLSTFGTGGNNQPFVVCDKTCFDVRLTSLNTKNKRANVYETKLARTINTGLNSPEANQGGLAIVYSTSKNSHHTNARAEMTDTLVASDYKDPPVVNDMNEDKHYVVRRLTPKECARLQGFPDCWCDNLQTENPSDEELIFWQDVFETHRKLVTNACKPKSKNQIIKWLKNPHTDSAEYKMWGNGVALPCVYFVLKNIAYFQGKEST